MISGRLKIQTAGASLFLFGVVVAGSAQAPVQNGAANPATPTQKTTQTATTPDHAAAYYHYMLAQRYKELAGMYNRGDYVDRAVSEYQQAIEADPDSLFLRVELAELYWRISRVQDAIDEVQQVLKVNPNDAEAHKLLAEIYLRSLGGNQSSASTHELIQKTITEFEAVMRLDPNDLDSKLMLGRLYKINNQPDKAEAIFKEVLESNPDSKSVLANLSQLYYDQGEYTKIIELLKSVPDSKMDPSILYLLGSAYAQIRDFAKADAAFEEALAREPDSEDIRRAYAETLVTQGELQKARDQLNEILKADPEDAPTYLRLSQLDRQMGRFDDARQDLTHAAAFAPDNLEVPYQEALLEDTLGNEDKAISILEDLLKKTEKPDGKYSSAEANNRSVFLQRIGLIYRSEEKYPEAIGYFRQIVALGGDQGARGESLIVETLQLSHQPQQAMDEANAAVEKYPHDRQLSMERASLMGQQGHHDEAVKQLQAMLKGTSEDRDIYLAIAQVYSQAKAYPKAEAAVQKALSLSNNSEDREYALFMLGSVYEREKKFDLAEQQFKQVLAQDPLNDAAANYLGYMLADRGVRLDESIKYIKEALQLEPNNGAYLDSLGWAYYKMNQFDQAQAPLEKAARLIVDDPTIREHLGYVYLRLGKKAQAQQEWEHALQVWHKSDSSDFGPEQANKLRKELNHLKHEAN